MPSDESSRYYNARPSLCQAVLEKILYYFDLCVTSYTPLKGNIYFPLCATARNVHVAFLKDNSISCRSHVSQTPRVHIAIRSYGKSVNLN